MRRRLASPLWVVAIAALAVPAHADPTIRDVTLYEGAVEKDVVSNLGAWRVVVSGEGLDATSVCKLVSAAGREFPLDLASASATSVTCRNRTPSATRPPIPPGYYRVRVGTPSLLTTSSRTVLLLGADIDSVQPSAVEQSAVQCSVLGNNLSTVASVKLRKADGTEWPAARFTYAAGPGTSGTLAVTWNPVPVGLYAIVVFNAAGIELAKTDATFRVFANAAQ